MNEWVDVWEDGLGQEVLIKIMLSPTLSDIA